jgi:hypothetical protein
MPCGSPCRLYIHRAFTYSVGPSSTEWSELGPASTFPPMRALLVQWSRAHNLKYEVALSYVLVVARAYFDVEKGSIAECFPKLGLFVK